MWCWRGKVRVEPVRWTMLRDNHFSSGAGMYVRYFVPEMKPARWHRKIIGVFSGNYKTIDANGQTKIVSSSFIAGIHGPKSSADQGTFFIADRRGPRGSLNQRGLQSFWVYDRKTSDLGCRQYKYSFIITYSRRWNWRFYHFIFRTWFLPVPPVYWPSVISSP